jgi:Tol biopolymer transport system component
MPMTSARFFKGAIRNALHSFSLFSLSSILFLGCNTAPTLPLVGDSNLQFPKEIRISNLRQLTFEGQNAEAYWSPDQRWLTFQHSGEDVECDQIFKLSLDGKEKVRLSNGSGRTTCSYFHPNGKEVLFSSTHASNKKCPNTPDHSKGYVWPIFNTYQLYKSDLNGERITPIEPGAPKAYNAELTACKNGQVVFTSDRNGDLDLYTAKLDSDGMLKDIKQITQTLGYDGGATFSPDCSKITWRAARPRTGKETEEYIQNLKKNLVKPTALEIWLANSDGTKAKQLTKLGGANFAPTFTPDGERVLFSSNHKKPGSRKFDLYLIRLNGTDLEQVTFSETFDSFPMFSPDGKYLAFSSNRYARKPHETNVFIADWNTNIMPAQITDQDELPENRVFSMIRELSSKDLEGRGVITKGIERAENYVIDHFERLKLKPYSEVFGSKNAIKEYEHPVTILTGVSADWKSTSLKADWKALKAKEDFAPAAFSAEKKISGELIDVGYGLVLPEKNHDDYSGKSVQGKVLLIRRGIPGELSLNIAQQSSYSDLRYKAFLARERKAAGILFWDPSASDKTSENLTTSLSDSSFSVAGDAGLPIYFLSKKLALEFLEAPKKIRFTGNIKLDRSKRSVSNIVGVYGDKKSCSSKRPVIIGAHLDHLGYGESTSLDSAIGRIIHPGADDNASGVVALIEAAQKMNDENARGCYLLVAFTAEEVGVVGSSKFADFLKAEGFRPKAMLNLDMVGRLRDAELFAFGTESATEWKSLISEACSNHSLKCTQGGDGFGPSDHMPFYLNQIPVVHFFTGNHEDYHRSTDTVEKINTTGVLKVADLVAEVAQKVAQSPALTFVKAKSSPSMGNVTGSNGDRVGTGAYLGTIPDYSSMSGATNPGSGGVKLTGARAGSPADVGGVKAGDIVVGITVLDEEPGVELVEKKTYDIGDLQEYTFVLQQLKPGQRIRLRVKRNKRSEELLITVGRKI